MSIKLRSAFITFAVAAVISSGMITPAVATQVAAPASTPSVVHVLKNYNCGWSITTKYHSCDLAYSLVLNWVEKGDYPSKIESVFSPNSGRRYDVKCTGVKTVTCKSNKGLVKFQPSRIPMRFKCAALRESVWGFAWLNSSCQFATAVVEAYRLAGGEPSTLTVVDPTDGMTYSLVCSAVGQSHYPRLCLSGRKAVVIEWEW